MLIRLGPKLFRPILIWFGPFFVWSRYFPLIWIWSRPFLTEPDLVGIFYPPIWIWSEPFTTDSDLFSTDLEVVQPFFLIRIWSGTFFIKSRSGQGYFRPIQIWSGPFCPDQDPTSVNQNWRHWIFKIANISCT